MKKQRMVADSFKRKIKLDIQWQVAWGKRNTVHSVTKPKSANTKFSCFFKFLRCDITRRECGAYNERLLLKSMTFYSTGMYVEVNRTWAVWGKTTKYFLQLCAYLSPHIHCTNDVQIRTPLQKLNCVRSLLSPGINCKHYFLVRGFFEWCLVLS